MAVTVTEKSESRRLTTGENATLELVFNVFGTDDEAEAKQAVLATAPESYGSKQDPPYLCRQGVQLEPVGPTLWTATVLYDRSWEIPIQAQDSFAFDTAGGTQHITQSRLRRGASPIRRSLRHARATDRRRRCLTRPAERLQYTSHGTPSR
jgi:hypothetical protein